MFMRIGGVFTYSVQLIIQNFIRAHFQKIKGILRTSRSRASGANDLETRKKEITHSKPTVTYSKF